MISIPLVRKVMPTLLAQELCSVQPMTGPTGSIFTMKTTPSLSMRIGSFESYVCDLSDMFKEWQEEFLDSEIVNPIVKLLHRLCHKSEICEEELDEMVAAAVGVFDVLDARYPDCAFDFQMRGFPRKWDYKTYGG